MKHYAAPSGAQESPYGDGNRHGENKGCDLYKEQTSEEKIDEAFNTFLVENNKQYNADQFNFIRTIKSVFMKKKHIEFSDLFEPPFTNFGINAPIPLFQKEELGGWMDFFGELENEVFAL